MQCNSKLCYIFIFLRQYSKIIYFISEIVTVTGLLGLYYVTMSSINKTNCGRRKGLTEPRRKVKCPVSECEYTGRIDNAKAHLRSKEFGVLNMKGKLQNRMKQDTILKIF